MGLALVVLASGVATVAPAQATHQFVYGHWYAPMSGYSQPPIKDHNATARNGFSFYENAAQQWRQVNTIFPWLNQFGGDPYDCGFQPWAIVVCIANYGSGTSRTYVYTTPVAGSQHTYGVIIQLRAGYPYSDNELRAASTYSIGHALGLGDRTNWNDYSVMHPVSPPYEYPDRHDFDGIIWETPRGHGH